MATSGDLVPAVRRLARNGPDLSVTADLSVTVDNVGDRIRVQIPSVRAGLSLRRSVHERLPSISRVLSEADLTAEIRVGSAVMAVAGADAAPGVLSRLLSLGQVEVRPRALVSAVLRPR